MLDDKNRMILSADKIGLLYQPSDIPL